MTILRGKSLKLIMLIIAWLFIERQLTKNAESIETPFMGFSYFSIDIG